MIWVQLSATLLIGAVLALAWARYSIETGWRRRAAELCLWIGPDLPFLVAALQFVISRPPASAANPAPATISIVAPAAALHVLLLAGVWRTLRTAVNAPSRDAEVKRDNGTRIAFVRRRPALLEYTRQPDHSRRPATLSRIRRR